MQGQPILEGSEINLHFGVQITGRAGCNFYTAEYSISPDQIQVTFFSITVMKCPSDPIMAQENTYTDLLTTSTMKHPVAYRIDKTIQPERLQILGPDGKIILLYEAMPDSNS